MEVCRTLSLFSVVYVTVPSMTIGQKIAREVVKRKLAACVNIIPNVVSIYEWDGKLNEDNELLLIIKTKTNAIENLKKSVLENHPYEVPEFISFSIEHGNEPYLNWIKKQVKCDTKEN